MKGILSFFSGRQNRRGKTGTGEDKVPSLPPEQPMVLPSVPKPDLRDEEGGPERTGRADGAEGDAAGPIRRITEFIRSLAVRAEESIRGVTGSGPVVNPAGEEGRVDSRILSSVLPGNDGTGETRSDRPDAERNFGFEAEFTPGGPQADAVYSGRSGYFSNPEFRADVREDDIPFRREGFTGEASGEWPGRTQESFRSLLERTGEMKEILSRLNEMADEIRKELTI